MAEPLAPTPNMLVRAAVIRAGRPNPEERIIDEAYGNEFQEVKSDIKRTVQCHSLLEKTQVINLTNGTRAYSVPSDYFEMKSMVILDGPDTWRGTAQAADATTITLAADFPTETSASMVGKYVVITAASTAGAGEYAQITGYVDSTKVCTIAAWSTPTTPSGTITYLVSNYREPVTVKSQMEIDTGNTPDTRSRPCAYAMNGTKVEFNYTPDKIYAVLVTYYRDMEKMDETDAEFLALCREWRAIWIQGTKAKVMERFDDSRYNIAVGVYRAMLDELRHQALPILEVQRQDI